jgi:aspartate dehydrogenase
MKRIGLIGLGVIGRSIADRMSQSPPPDCRLVAICVKPSQLREAASLYGEDVRLCTTVEQLLETKPDIVIEAARQTVVAESGGAILAAGADFYVLSVGALAQDGLRDTLIQSARQTGAKIIIPAGAFAGFDGLLAMRASGIESVIYVSSKPPQAWRGTLAEKKCDLGALSEPVTFFSGSARDAALLYPQNANLAAAIAIGGIGLDRTQVELIADPAATLNVGRMSVIGALGRLDVNLSSNGSDRNPKTSIITGMSVIASITNRQHAICYA